MPAAAIRKAEVNKINNTLKIQDVIKAIDKKAKSKKKGYVKTRKGYVKTRKGYVKTRKVAVILPPRERLDRGAKTAAVVKISEIANFEQGLSPQSTPASLPVLMPTVKIPSPILSTTKTPAPTTKTSLDTTKAKTVTFKSSVKPNSIYKDWADKIFDWNHSGEGLRSGIVMGDILTLDKIETSDSITDFLKGPEKNCLIALLEKYKNYPFLTPTEIYVRYKKIMAGKEQIKPEKACSMVDVKIMDIYGNAKAKWGTNISYRANDEKQGTSVFKKKYANMKSLVGGNSSKQKTRRTTQRPRTTQRRCKTLKNKHNKTHRQT